MLWLLLQFIVLLTMDAKGVRNMYNILVVLINTILPEFHLIGLLYIIL